MKRIVIGLLGVVLALSMVGCATVSTKPNEVALAYTGGPIEGVTFDKVVPPGSGTVFLGVADGSYSYSTDVRDYTASNEAGDAPDGAAFACNTSDGVSAEFAVIVYFKLNTSKSRSFHENNGLKFNAYNGGEYKMPDGSMKNGWEAMLATQFRPQLEDSVIQTCKRHTADEIHKDPNVYDKLPQEVAAGLKDRITETFSGEYFCGPQYNGEPAEDGNAECPDFQVVVKKAVITDQAVLERYSNQKATELNKVAVENEGQNKIIEKQRQAEADVAEAQGKAQAQAELEGIYNDPAYIEYLKALAMAQCAGNSNCTLVITNDPTTGVNVQTAPQG